MKRALSQENAVADAADAARGEEIIVDQIRDRGDVAPYPYAALVKHKLTYLLSYRPQKLGEQLEELKKLADLTQTSVERLKCALRPQKVAEYLERFPDFAEPVIHHVSVRLCSL